MTDIDKKIELAKKKSLTAENLNYIGDLYLQKNEKERAVAYFFETSKKPQFSQKEKKIAIYKKILNISPVSEQAYIGLIEILSKSGFIMEEKKYLHMLAQLYKSRGEADKAAALFTRLRELDPHVIIDGTFFHQEAFNEVTALQNAAAVKAEDVKDAEEVPATIHDHAMRDTEASSLPVDMQGEKLIEATLEEISPEKSYAVTDSAKIFLWRRYFLWGGIVIVAFVAAVVYYFRADNRDRSVSSLPVTARVNDYDIALSKLDDLAELAGDINKHDLETSDFFVLTVNSQRSCLPDAFATSPYNMISLLDRKGGSRLTKPVEGLHKSMKTIFKMNVCGKDNACIFLRMIIAVDRQNRYSGLAISGLQNTGPVTISW